MNKLRDVGVKRDRKQHLVAAVLAIATLLTACDVKDPIYNTSHPEKGQVTITADWSGIGEGVTAPDSYTVWVNDRSFTVGGATQPMTMQRSSFTAISATPPLNLLLEPGKYHMRVYNTPEHITVNGATATVAPDNTAGEGSGLYLSPTPGWFFAGATDFVIEKDTDYDFTIGVEKDTDHGLTCEVEQHVGVLTLIIEPTGGTADQIKSIVGYLSDVASSLDFEKGMFSAPMNVALTFSKITSGTDAGKWSATVRLLGVLGNPQLTTDIVIGDGHGPIRLHNDLSKQLENFNDNKREPLILRGIMVETPTGAGFGATITDWTPVTGSGTAD